MEKPLLEVSSELSQLDDRRLNERIALELIKSNRIQRRILDNVLFFFWYTLISAALIFVAYNQIEYALRHIN